MGLKIKKGRTMKCNKHPTYKALRKPTADCETCRKMWDDQGDRNIFYVDVGDLSTEKAKTAIEQIKKDMELS